MAQEQFGISGFVVRLVVALILVFGTFNPSGYSFYHWALAEGGRLPLKFVVGTVLAIVYIVYLRATWRSIGPIGLVLAIAFFGGIIWTVIDFGLVDTAKPTVMAYLLLILVSLVMAVGLSWSHVRRRVSGQSDIDDLET